MKGLQVTRRTTMKLLPTIFTALSLAMIGSACSKPTIVESPVAQPSTQRVLPVTMIEQELPLPLQQSWKLVTLALAQQDIPLAEVLEQESLLITEWIPMVDHSCTTVTAARVPMNCETQYRIALFAQTQDSSILRIRYTEDCTSEHQVYLTCPNSNAEQRMIAIVDDIKALAGIALPQ